MEVICNSRNARPRNTSTTNDSRNTGGVTDHVIYERTNLVKVGDSREDSRKKKVGVTEI